MNLGSRTTANLIAVALASAALIVYALAQLLTGALLDDSYPLKVRVPATGGLIPQQQATLSGVPVGLVTDFTLVDDEVEIELAIDEGRRIPRDVDVVILRRSAVGEQAIDFRPREGAGEDYFEPGDVVEPGSVVTPVEVQRLLTLADEVFSPVDPENAGKLVSEMADIVRGRRDDIRSMISDSAEFSADIADNGQDYDRLFAEGRKVTASLARNREALASSIGDMADAAAVLSDMRSDFEGLLADAPPMLASVTDVMQRGDANLSCVITSLAGINEYMAQPRQMRETENALRFNRWFFGAYEVIVQKDHAGRTWNRIQFIPPQQPPAGSYLPDKRPIPDILPGGACSSPFGDGAPAAHQADYRKTVPEARIVRPQDDRAEPVRSAGYDSTLVGARRPGGGDTGATGTSPGAGGAATGEAGTDVAQAGDASSPPSGRLPLTGLGAATLLLLGLLFIAAGLPAARARLRPPADADAADDAEDPS